MRIFRVRNNWRTQKVGQNLMVNKDKPKYTWRKLFVVENLYLAANFVPFIWLVVCGKENKEIRAWILDEIELLRSQRTHLIKAQKLQSGKDWPCQGANEIWKSSWSTFWKAINLIKMRRRRIINSYSAVRRLLYRIFFKAVSVPPIFMWMRIFCKYLEKGLQLSMVLGMFSLKI